MCTTAICTYCGKPPYFLCKKACQEKLAALLREEELQEMEAEDVGTDDSWSEGGEPNNTSEDPDYAESESESESGTETASCSGSESDG